jgi:hypothetical protein
MSYQRKELHLIENFDLKLTDGKDTRSQRFKDKYLIVLDVENHDKGLYVLTTSLSNKPYISMQLLDTCNKHDTHHFYKFDCQDICDTYTFKKQTYLSGKRGDIFNLSIAELSNLYKPKYSKKKGVIKDEVFISILECLKESDFLMGETIKKLESLYNEEVKSLALKPVSVVSEEVKEKLSEILIERKTDTKKFSRKDISRSDVMRKIKKAK